MSRAARLGAFILATVAILGIGIFIIGNKKYLFSDTYQLRAQFSNVVGLSVGAEARVGGVHRGTVHRIDLPNDPSEKITVVLDLDSSTRHIIKKDSVASIETEGLLGNEYIAISFGSTAAGEVHNGDLIASQPPLQIADLIKKTNGILDSSQQAISNVTQATANLSSVSSKINNGQGTMGELINNKKVYNELDQTMSGMKDTIAQAQSGVADFQEIMEALKHNFFVRGYFKNRGYEDSAELAKDEVVRLPRGTPLKTFTFDAKQLFDKQGTAKLKNQKSLGAAGEFLSDTDFGIAVVVAYTGMEGDTSKDLMLSQGRAMVVREYLVENFSFDDTRVKTLGMGKKPDVSPEMGWGKIEVVVYPPGTEVPPEAQSSKNASDQAVPAPKGPKPE